MMSQLFARLGRSRLSRTLVLALPLLLAGCLEPAAPTGPSTEAQASRFLHQATFGPSQADIDKLMSLGYQGWIEEQFETPPVDTYVDYANRGGPPGCEICMAIGLDLIQESFWFQAIEGKDQLRQRVALALSELFVVSGETNSVLREQDLALASFNTMLAQNAFGNFRDLLEQVALHPAMGVYLSHLQNDKEDPATGRLPDENFAREVMQLFTIGKWELNHDGTLKRDAAGNPIPTYGQAEIMGMAKVFTGWSWGGSDTSDARWAGYNIGAEDTRDWLQPMQPYPGRHSTAEKTIVGGVTIAANTSAQESLRIALDTLFNHPNTAPFVATHLIKRLVTSNPSPAYVSRVASVFMSNDRQERGNMRSVVRAVLFDPEGLGLTEQPAHAGKLREPILRVTNYLRAFNATNPQQIYQIHNLQLTPHDIGQTPWMAPSVFNFFAPDHSPAGDLNDNALTAPEFEIFDEATSVGYLNYLQRGIEQNFSEGKLPISVNYARETALAADPAALVTRLAMLLNGGHLSAGTRTAIESALASIPAGSADWQRKRVQMAITLVMGSPDYLIQK